MDDDEIPVETNVMKYDIRTKHMKQTTSCVTGCSKHSFVEEAGLFCTSCGACLDSDIDRTYVCCENGENEQNLTSRK